MKQLLLVICACAIPCLCMAQQKRVKSITDYERGKFYCSVEWTYDGQNRPLRSEYQGRDGANEHLVMEDIYDGDDGVTIDVGGEGYRDVCQSVVRLVQGRITAMDVLYSSGGKTPDYSKHKGYSITYDGEGHLLQMDSDDETLDMTWTGGNLVKQHGKEKHEDDYTYDTDFEYSNLTASSRFPFFFQIIEDPGELVEFELAYPQYYLPQYFGTRPKNLLSKITVNENKRGKTYTDIYSFNYVLDDDGDVTEVIITEDGETKEHIHYYITYEGTDGIAMPMTTTVDSPCQIFSLSGMSAPRSLKGLNIVKTADGRKMKVIR